MLQHISGFIKDNFNSYIPIEKHEDGDTESPIDGPLSPVGSPRSRWGHRRRLGLSNPRTRKILCTTTALAVLTVLGLWWSLRHFHYLQIPVKEDDGGLIPLGQSRYRDGREVFWWEQFPKLQGFYRGRKDIVSMSQYVSEQHTNASDIFDVGDQDGPELLELPLPLPYDLEQCYIDEEKQILPPLIRAYQGLPQGMPEPLFGSSKELGLQDDICYDRVNRFAPYGAWSSQEQGGLGLNMEGDTEGVEQLKFINWDDVNWHLTQQRCLENNGARLISRTAFILRTWHTFHYTEYHIMMLRAMISELSLASGGQYTVHFLIQVQDGNLPIWADQDLYNQVLNDSLPAEFQGMGTLWSTAQMKLIYLPPFDESIENISGGDIYGAYRSLHFALQYFASRHPEFDYFWQWEMDIRVTGHYHELLNQVTSWAEKQPREYSWEYSSNFFIPSLHNYSYASFVDSIMNKTTTPIYGPQLAENASLDIPSQRHPPGTNDIVDLITFNPLFDPSRTRWAFRNDITGYNISRDGRPPTRAALITATRLSRRLLQLMHEETYRHHHTMFPEMFPASIALHYGLKAVYAPLPVYFDRDWPAEHANEVFNNAPISKASKQAGMDHGKGHFHGDGGSVFGPGEHVFRGGTYYSEPGFAGYLWRRWLGKENAHGEVAWDTEGDAGGSGRMCLPMMVLHPVKYE
ncbi:hypothetical protein PV11_03648 [Exophiala sideris]|uniref:Uncharacterized protein n=1 Tax=Exophiala sideris TaxID=1016849 RepID=A0A0D1X1T8_9EURO|nr:hypothetical protein PV11_03648 [Exophiala sideris]